VYSDLLSTDGIGLKAKMLGFDANGYGLALCAGSRNGLDTRLPLTIIYKFTAKDNKALLGSFSQLFTMKRAVLTK